MISRLFSLNRRGYSIHLRYKDFFSAIISIPVNQPYFQEISNRTHWTDPSTWVSNSSSNLLRGPLVRSDSIFDGIMESNQGFVATLHLVKLFVQATLFLVFVLRMHCKQVRLNGCFPLNCSHLIVDDLTTLHHFKGKCHSIIFSSQQLVVFNHDFPYDRVTNDFTDETWWDKQLDILSNNRKSGIIDVVIWIFGLLILGDAFVALTLDIQQGHLLRFGYFRCTKNIPKHNNFL